MIPLTVFGYLWFYLNFIIIFSSSVENAVDIFIWIALNL